MRPYHPPRLEPLASDAQLRLALDAVSDGIWEWLPSSNETRLCARSAELFGFSPSAPSPSGDEVFGRIHPEDIDRVQAQLMAHVRGETPTYHSVFRVNRPSGSTLWILGRGRMVARDTPGARIIGTCTDVTVWEQERAAREALQARLNQAHKLESLGLMAGGIAHGFNNLLVGVQGHASLLMESLAPGSELRQDVELILSAAQRAADLAAQMLAYAGRARLQREILNLPAALRQLAPRLQALAPLERLSWDLSAAPLPVNLDLAQLHEATLHLVKNAVEASHGQAQVTLRARRVEVDEACLETRHPSTQGHLGSYALLEVQDQGPGLTPQARARMFDPFYTSKATGRGLGLAMVLGFVRGHQGFLVVESEAGQGTRLRVYLPLSDAAAPTMTPHPQAEPAVIHGEGAALIIDDEPVVRTVLSKALRPLGFEIHVARDGFEGLALFEQLKDQLSLVISDLTMPGLNGIEVFKRVHAQRPALPVILSSGYDREEALAGLRDGGPACYLQKPYTRSTLLRAVREALTYGNE
ncbi:response regulator [Myxococcota bacterium]|nr:response regulator [Myxococcota bacterium]